jgi:ADP-ribose pyrophosphatase
MKKFKCLSQKIIHSNPYIDYIDDEYIMPNGEHGHYYYMRSKNSVLVIPQLTEDRFIMIRQFRYIPQRWCLEFPGGAQKQGKKIITTAYEELLEETGYKADKLEHIGRFSPCIGLIDEMCEIFIATDLTLSVATPEDSEEIEIVEMTSNEINKTIKNGELWSGMTQAAWLQYRMSLNEMEKINS